MPKACRQIAQPHGHQIYVSALVLPDLKEFQKYDLYTKTDESLDYNKLIDYYENLFIFPHDQA